MNIGKRTYKKYKIQNTILLYQIQYKQIVMIQTQKQQHSQNKSITVAQLQELPLQLLQTLLTYPNLPNLPQPIPIPVSEYEYNSGPRILLYLHCLLNTNYNQALQKLQETIAALYQTNIQLCQCIVKMYVFHEICIRKSVAHLSQFRDQVGGPLWGCMLAQVCQILQNRQSQVRDQFVNLWMHSLQSTFINDYLKQPTSTHFEVFKNILQLSITTHPSYPNALLHNYLTSYLQYLTSSGSSLPLPFPSIKVLQLLQTCVPGSNIGKQLASHKIFMEQQLYACLCDFQTKGANSLAINVYASILTQLAMYDQYFQAFVDVYATLDSYGMHLIKDIWHRFYVLAAGVNSQQAQHTYFLLQIRKLLHILLLKNVPKYCIQHILSSPLTQTLPLFQHLSQTVYKSLIQVLNSGSHYNDITHFHQDSKIYAMTKIFYLNYFNYLKQNKWKDKFVKNVGLLLHGLREYVVFQHCLMAYIGILQELPYVIGEAETRIVVSQNQISIIVYLVEKYLHKLTFRKRYNFSIAVITFIVNHVHTKSISLQQLMKLLIMKLPMQLLQLRPMNTSASVLPLIFGVFNRYEVQTIHDYINTLTVYLNDIKSQIQHSQLDPQSITYKQYCTTAQQLTVLHYYISKAANPSHNSQLHTLYSCTLQHLSTSLYAHPIQYRYATQTIALLASIDQQQIVHDIRNDNRIGQLLLLVVSKCQIGCAQHDLYKCIGVVAKAIQVCDHKPICVSYAKFIQYCISHITQPIYLNLLLHALTQKLQYTRTYKSIQQSLYSLYSLYSGHNSNSAPPLSPKLSLRLSLVLFTILCNDYQFAIQKLLTDRMAYVQDIRNYCDLYDYQHFQEFFMWVQAVCKVYAKGYRKGTVNEAMWQQFKDSIVGHIKESIKYYGIHAKQVTSSTTTLVYIAMMLQLNQPAIQLIDYILQIGQKYWGFQRNTGLLLLNQLQQIRTISKIKQGYIGVLQRLIEMEEYRGEDSYILLTQHNNMKVYTQQLMHKQANYDGTAIRFIAIEWAHRQLSELIAIKNKQEKGQNLDKEHTQRVELWTCLFERVFNVCITDTSKERMFMTGSHKTKIKYCQFLMLFPQFLSTFLPFSFLHSALISLVKTMSQNNLTQIKHYLQSFTLRLLDLCLNHPQFTSLHSQVSQILLNQLLQVDGQNSLLKNVSYMVFAGLVLEIKVNQRLFNVLFSYVCSHVAYYRGISQYFCYAIVQKWINCNKTEDNILANSSSDTKYINILYKQYLKDIDAIKLTNKLHKIVQQYKQYIRKWSIYTNLINMKPTLNGQIISNDHYIDRLKYLGSQLIKQHKHQDGYMPYREAWKKIAIQQKIIQSQQQKQVIETQSYQKKIDPSLDDLYSFQPVKRMANNNQLKIVVVSAKQIALYGHMARVGQILGISELCIPNLNIVDMEDFYNVSVTAQKWLNITEHKLQLVKTTAYGQKRKQKKAAKKPAKTLKKKQINDESSSPMLQLKNKQLLMQMLNNHKNEGYQIYVVDKGTQTVSNKAIQSLDINKKAILIIDQLNLIEKDLKNAAYQQVCFGLYYSYHVQATVFMWEYFKKHSMKNGSQDKQN